MHRKLIENGCLNRDKKAFIQYLRDMDYQKGTLEMYEWVIKRLDQFMYDHKQSQYARDIGDAFLEDAVISKLYTPGSVKVLVYVIRRFNCFMEQGEFAVIMPKTNRKTPLGFAEGFEKYIDHLKLVGQRDASIRRKHSTIQRALIDFTTINV